METGILKAVSAMTDIDEGFILEAAELKKQNKSINKKAVFGYAAAAAAVLLTAGVVFMATRFNKDGGSHSAMQEPGGPAETDAPGFAPLPDFTEPHAVSTDAPHNVTPEPPDSTGKPFPAETACPTPDDTPSPTAGGAKPTSSAEPSSAPTSEPTGEPYIEERRFAGLEEFISAVREGRDPLLEGIDRYYTPEGFPADRTWLAEIKVDADSVTYRYYLAGGAEFKLVWFRSTGYSQRLYNDLLENNPEGTMHGSLFVFLTQAGYYIGAQLDDGHLLRMHTSAHFSEDEMVNCCAFARHEI